MDRFSGGDGNSAYSQSDKHEQELRSGGSEHEQTFEFGSNDLASSGTSVTEIYERTKKSREESAYLEASRTFLETGNMSGNVSRKLAGFYEKASQDGAPYVYRDPDFEFNGRF